MLALGVTEQVLELLKICANRNMRFSTDQAHKLASVPFLADRRRAHVLNFMYKRQGRRDLLNKSARCTTV